MFIPSRAAVKIKAWLLLIIWLKRKDDYFLHLEFKRMAFA